MAAAAQPAGPASDTAARLLEDFKRCSLAAHQLLDAGLRLDGAGDDAGAARKYEEGIKQIKMALVAVDSAPPVSSPEWDQARATRAALATHREVATARMHTLWDAQKLRKLAAMPPTPSSASAVLSSPFQSAPAPAPAAAAATAGSSGAAAAPRALAQPPLRRAVR